MALLVKEDSEAGSWLSPEKHSDQWAGPGAAAPLQSLLGGEKL